jgi:hypothetical protein
LLLPDVFLAFAGRWRDEWHDCGSLPHKENSMMTVSTSEPAKAPAETTTTQPGSHKARARVSRKPSQPAVSAASKKGKAPATRPGTKTAKILRLLGRPGGASLAELTKATGWQPHSVRGFLSGAVKRKMRLKLASVKRADGERAYRVASK